MTSLARSNAQKPIEGEPKIRGRSLSVVQPTSAQIRSPETSVNKRPDRIGQKKNSNPNQNSPRGSAVEPETFQLKSVSTCQPCQPSIPINWLADLRGALGPCGGGVGEGPIELVSGLGWKADLSRAAVDRYATMRAPD